MRKSHNSRAPPQSRMSSFFKSISSPFSFSRKKRNGNRKGNRKTLNSIQESHNPVINRVIEGVNNNELYSQLKEFEPPSKSYLNQMPRAPTKIPLTKEKKEKIDSIIFIYNKLKDIIYNDYNSYTGKGYKKQTRLVLFETPKNELYAMGKNKQMTEKNLSLYSDKKLDELLFTLRNIYEMMEIIKREGPIQNVKSYLPLKKKYNQLFSISDEEMVSRLQKLKK